MREPKDTVFPAIMEYGPLITDRFFPVCDSRSLRLSTQSLCFARWRRASAPGQWTDYWFRSLAWVDIRRSSISFNLGRSRIKREGETTCINERGFDEGRLTPNRRQPAKLWRHSLTMKSGIRFDTMIDGVTWLQQRQRKTCIQVKWLVSLRMHGFLGCVVEARGNQPTKDTIVFIVPSVGSFCGLMISIITLCETMGSIWSNIDS